MKRIIIGISGASGTIYGVKILEILSKISNIETHLVMSKCAIQTLNIETKIDILKIKKLASFVHKSHDIAACISSGSFKTYGMVILPCSIKTLSGIVCSNNENLLIRAADVILKERRLLVLCIRETPLHLGHLRLMVSASEMGAVIMPPIPAFYYYPDTIDDIVSQTVIRVLDQFNITVNKSDELRWKGV